MGFIIGTPDRNYSRVCDLGRGGYIPNFTVQKVELHINKYSFKHEKLWGDLHRLQRLT